MIRPDERSIHLLANGYPINFWGMDSMPDQASDLVMSLLFLGALRLAQSPPLKAGVDPDTINTLADEYRVAKLYRNLHKPR